MKGTALSAYTRSSRAGPTFPAGIEGIGFSVVKIGTGKNGDPRSRPAASVKV